MIRQSITILAVLSLLGCSKKINTTATNVPPKDPAPQLYSNPLFENGADPWVIKDGDVYHYCYSKGNGLAIRTASSPQYLPQAEEKLIWHAPKNTSYSKEIWAPELHKINGYYYVYFAADDGDNFNHKMHIIKSRDKSMEGGFEYVGQLKTREDKWAIDGTTLFYKGQRYFIWSGWEGDVNVAQNLYIAQMDTPTSISSPRVMISRPDQEWEKRGSGNGAPTINEGPQIVQRGDQVFILYSASGSWSNFYCLGMLELTGDDLMDPASWTKSDGPVFEGTDCIYSPGHASFTTIGQQDWIVYHTARHKGAGWDRKVKMQPFYWKDDKPFFGAPVQDGVVIPID